MNEMVSATMYDYYVTKKNVPTNNDKTWLEFVFPADPNLFLLKNKIIIKGSIEMHKDYVVENGFVSKLFDTLTVEVNSTSISHHKTSGDYWLSDYIYKYGNYNKESINSLCQPEGYFDVWNVDKTVMGQVESAKQGLGFDNRQLSPNNGDIIKYYFAFVPNFGFLRDTQPLMKGCELKLKFDRAKSPISFVKKIDTDQPFPDNIPITGCVAQTEWVSSPALRAHFETIDSSPIEYRFDDCQVYLKNLDQDQKTVRINQIRSGNLPTHIFAAIIDEDALSGDVEKSSTGFKCHGVSRFNISIDGTSVNGYPINVENGSPVYPLVKFNDTLDKITNISCSGGFTMAEFAYNYIWSHHFQAEQSSTGWINIDIDFKAALSDSKTLVIWCISPYSILLDKFRQIERVAR